MVDRGRVLKVLGKICRLLLGSEEIIFEKFGHLYEGDESNLKTFADVVLKEQKKRAIAFFLIWGLLVILSGFLAVNNSKDLLLAEDGSVLAIERPQEGQGVRHFDAKVSALSGRQRMTKTTQVRVEALGSEEGPPAERGLHAESQAMVFERKLQTEIRKLNEEQNEKLFLPRSLEDGTKLLWQEEKTNRLPLLLTVFLAGVFLLYRSRFRRAKVLEAAALESISLDLPAFVNQLLLFLKSGLIFSEAFKRTVINMTRYKGNLQESYFLEQIERIERSYRQANSSLDKELIEFARRSQVPELLRIGGIIKENLSKGTDLTKN